MTGKGAWGAWGRTRTGGSTRKLGLVSSLFLGHGNWEVDGLVWQRCYRELHNSVVLKISLSDLEIYSRPCFKTQSIFDRLDFAKAYIGLMRACKANKLAKDRVNYNKKF